jgi:hypothetical protein
MHDGVIGVVAAGHRAGLERSGMTAHIMPAIHGSRLRTGVVVMGSDGTEVRAATKTSCSDEACGESRQKQEEDTEQAKPSPARACAARPKVCSAVQRKHVNMMIRQSPPNGAVRHSEPLF